MICGINTLERPAHGPFLQRHPNGTHGRKHASALDWILELRCLFLFVCGRLRSLTSDHYFLKSGMGATKTRLNLPTLNWLPLRFSRSLISVWGLVIAGAIFAAVEPTLIPKLGVLISFGVLEASVSTPDYSINKGPSTSV